MKKYVSRAKNKLALVLLCAFLVFMLAGYISSNCVIMFISLPFFMAGVILMFSANHCPHCGAYFRGLYWSKPNAGYCVKCGKIIEFDDCKNKE